MLNPMTTGRFRRFDRRKDASGVFRQRPQTSTEASSLFGVNLMDRHPAVAEVKKVQPNSIGSLHNRYAAPPITMPAPNDVLVGPNNGSHGQK